MPLLRSRRALAALTVAALPLAACGSSSSNNSGGTATGAADPANYAKALGFSQCMRSHGVPNFPDPKANGSGGMLVQQTPTA